MYFVGDYLDEFYDCDALLFDYFYEINYFLCDSKLHGREVVLIGPIVDVATLTGGWKGCDIHSLLAISPHPLPLPSPLPCFFLFYSQRPSHIIYNV